MSTVFVTLCNESQQHRAHQTIKDLRTRGEWVGDIVLVTVDYKPSPEFLTEYQVTSVQFARFDVSHYVAKLREKPFTVPTNDGREFNKTVQWEKLHLFELWFRERWERVVFLDAGLRVLAPVTSLLALPWRGRFLAPDDTQGKTYRFRVAVETENWPDALHLLQTRYGLDLEDRYFLNCMWVYDTNLAIPVEEFLSMLEYPVWRHNEMGAMNAILHFHRRLWTPFPEKQPDGKYLFDWCELNRGSCAHWSEYTFLKYPITLSFDV
jgi:hypothetical protein